MALFKAIAGRTKLSNKDKFEHLRNSLSQQYKVFIAQQAVFLADYKQLVINSLQVDHVQDLLGHQFTENKHGPSLSTSPISSSSNAYDEDTMVIDANWLNDIICPFHMEAEKKAAWQCTMEGRCRGCGSTTHKKDPTHAKE